MNDDGNGIQYFDNPWTGKKIRSTPESRLKARRNYAKNLCERAYHRGFGKVVMEQAQKACYNASLNFSTALEPFIKMHKEDLKNEP